ncbi:MAG: HetP family heterocyst commitment protein [Cyanobacteriota bacterium]
MSQQIPFSNSSLNKTLSSDQLNQIVEAILAGKYSWACVLLLRAISYDPLHYIPYRTYNRLLKENCEFSRYKRHNSDSSNPELKIAELRQDSTDFSSKNVRQLRDLCYLEVVDESDTNIKGGSCSNDQGHRVLSFFRK